MEIETGERDLDRTERHVVVPRRLRVVRLAASVVTSGVADGRCPPSRYRDVAAPQLRAPRVRWWAASACAASANAADTRPTRFGLIR